ncbi:hypothetical protein EDD17DRAFT_1515404 [Pisolithus thermaeus]|nr:hypothetical protein EV401DRAFT_1890070 [Pisolithus croceorrhizus]KAI6143874.1 hypothetical protein EDD17DRAFT_1515404 [Pisolithus thermaeus]
MKKKPKISHLEDEGHHTWALDSSQQCLSYKSESCLLEGYEVYGGKVKAPHSGGWSTNLESTATSSTRKLTEKDASSIRTPRTPCIMKQTPPGIKGRTWRMQEGPHLNYGLIHLLYGVLHQVFETTKLGIKLKQNVYTHCFIGLKCAKVFDGSNQLKTPLKLSFRFQGAVVPSTSSTELEGSSLLQWVLSVSSRRHSLECLHKTTDIRSSKNPSEGQEMRRVKMQLRSNLQPCMRSGNCSRGI